MTLAVSVHSDLLYIGAVRYGLPARQFIAIGAPQLTGSHARSRGVRTSARSKSVAQTLAADPEPTAMCFWFANDASHTLASLGLLRHDEYCR